MNYIKIEKQDGIATVILDKPSTFNALDSEMLSEFCEMIDTVEKDPEISVIILSGTGKVFVSGADIGEMIHKSPLEARAFSQTGAKLFRRLELLEKPVICAVNGFALGGGCELAMCCDIRLASEKAKFGLPEVTLGITPGFSGTARLPRLIGLAKAKEWIYTGKIASAQEAMDAGLVNAVYPPETLLDEAKNMAAAIAKNSKTAIKLCKTLLNHSLESDIDAAIDLEINVEAIVFGSHDQVEGMSAFKEKRKPVFE